MAGSALVDPFDDPTTIEQLRGGAPVKTDLIDPFDSPEALADIAQKTGAVSNASPRGRKMVASENPASFLDVVKGSTMEDPQAKLEYYASKRFPDDPNAAKRYGYIGDDLVFVNDSGQYEKELEGKTPEGNAAILAGKVLGGAGLPMAGATIGGMIGGAPGAGLGGMAGRGYQKIIARILGDDKETATEVGGDLAAEGLMNAAGWKAGQLFGEKVVDRRVVKDIGKFDSQKAAQLQKMAKEKFGVDLTPAETTELGSLINQQAKMGAGMNEAGDTIRAFLQRRAGQVDEAIDSYLGTTPPADAVGAAARRVGKTAIDTARKARTDKAKPIYEQFVNDSSRLLPKSAMKQFENDPVLKRAFADVRREGLYVDDAVPDHSITFVDAVKKHLDSMISKAKTSGEGGGKVAALEAKRKRLLDVADLYEPGYAQARAAFAEASPAVTNLEKGIEGVLANVPDSGLRKAAHKLLNPSTASPVDVATARSQFYKQGKQKEWNDVVRLYLRDIWEGTATKDVQSGANLSAGANFRKAVFGTKRQKQMMREALGPEEFQDFENLMSVLEATGRVSRGQSMTQPAQEYAKAMKRESAPVASAADDLVKFRLLDWWADAKAGKWEADLAKVITSPEAMSELKKLRKLRQVSPGSKNAISVVTSAFEKAGVSVASGVLSNEELPPPPAPQATQ